ncbi:tyrosine-type recombinase/integrase [Agathobaculum sp. Marseille-P7918]|uniref:tyrosine-type recombinase/integrase n=1 Tax=Agathobaculum sp. Marseille-P7918 TaxID=2479843 RepID=UPI003562E37A
MDRTWRDEEVNRMIGKTWGEGREDYAAAICLPRRCGLRIHEIFRLDTVTAKQALKTDQLTIKGKGGKVRTVPLPRTAQLELEAMLQQMPRGYKLFVPDATPTDLAINRFQCFLYRHRDAVQIADKHRPLTCHGLRHTYAVEQYLACRKQELDEHAACRHVSLREGGKRHG